MSDVVYFSLALVGSAFEGVLVFLGVFAYVVFSLKVSVPLCHIINYFQ